MPGFMRAVILHPVPLGPGFFGSGESRIGIRAGRRNNYGKSSECGVRSAESWKRLRVVYYIVSLSYGRSDESHRDGLHILTEGDSFFIMIKNF